MIKRTSNFLLLVCLFLTYSCQTTEKPKRPELLSYADYQKKDIQLPYVLDLQKGKKHLVYYGVRHSYNPGDSIFTDIEKRLLDLKPDFVFNEGGNGWPEINHRDSTIMLTGDPGFLRYLCRQHKLNVTSIEPPDSLEFAYLLTKYKKNDVVLMYFCRQIEQCQHQQGLSDKDFNEAGSNFLQALKNEGMPLAGNELKIEFVISYYEAFFKCKFNWHEFNPENYQPIFTKTLLNEIMRESTYFRDRFIVNTLEESFKKYDKIFVMMGGSHLVIEEPVLRYIMSQF